MGVFLWVFLSFVAVLFAMVFTIAADGDHSESPANSDASSTLMISWPQVNDLIISNTDPYLSWLTYCSDPESQWVNYALRYWTTDSLQFFLDFSPGIGRSFIPVAMIANIAMLSVKDDGDHNEYLFQNVNSKGLQNKVVGYLVKAPTQDYHPQHYISAFDYARSTLSLQCPDLVHLQYLYHSQSADAINLMENHRSIIIDCRSTIYFDTNATHLLRAVSEYLYTLNYSLEYTELCNSCRHETVGKNIRWMLYATPKPQQSSTHDEIPPGLILPSQKHWKSFDIFFRQAIYLNQPIECEEQKEDIVRELFQVRVPLSILVSSSSPVNCISGLIYDERLEDNHELIISQVPGMSDLTEQHLFFKWRCLAWTQHIRQHLDYGTYHLLREKAIVKMRHMQCVAMSAQGKQAGAGTWSMMSIKDQRRKFMSLVDQELDVVTNNCIAFVTHQYRYLDRMRNLKYPETTTDLYANKNITVSYQHHLTSTSETVVEKWFNVDSVVDDQDVADINDKYVDEYDNIGGDDDDEILPFHTSKNTIQRKPFQINWEPNVCDDPLYCRLTYEFQRRVFVWQNPDHRHAVDIKYHSPTYDNVEAEGPVPSAKRLWPNRTCRNAKFLIYEPVSENHGLGSMWEQIAGVMRFAICHDRILILNPRVDQSGTIRKWRLPGCAGNVWECYFHPVSMCSLSNTEYEQATQFLDTDDLDGEEWNNVRILRLKGYPPSGRCNWCDSVWPMDNSSFFDGMRISDLLIMTKKQREEYSTFRAFDTNMRHIHSTQFIRYLLRPQSWLEDMLPRLVSYSLVSPVQDNGNGPSSISPPFSPNFVSLHIRLGMKSVEERLPTMDRFMSVLGRKYPSVRDVFVSTETTAAIFNLTRFYPKYRFHHLHYIRNEYLFLRFSLPKENSPSWNFLPIDVEDDMTGEIHYHLAQKCEGVEPLQEFAPPHLEADDFFQCLYLKSLQVYNNKQLQHAFLNEILMSLANLYVASEAQGWVGTWTSNWCSVIAKMARTRGDGGGEYHGVDRGSFYTKCF